MPELHFPWLEFSILLPVLAAGWLSRMRDAKKIRFLATLLATLTLLLAVGEWIDFSMLGRFEAHDRNDLLKWLTGRDLLVVDELNAPLLPLVALIHLVVIASTPLGKAQRFSFPMAFLNEAVTLALFSSHETWWIVIMLLLGTAVPWLELKRRQRSTRVYAWHMGLFALLLVSGCSLQHWSTGVAAMTGTVLLAGACLVRSGIVPVHCWMTDLFEKCSFGMAILVVAPLPGAWAAMRLVVPVAPQWALQSISLLSLVTAVYCSGMALVQSEARRFYCYLVLSHVSLVLVGLELATPLGLAGALCVWLSASLAVVGFGIVLRCVESRIGRISLRDYHGLFAQMPVLAGFFLLTGLASIGFPGTVGFISMELLVEGVVEVWPLVGMAVIVATSLNGIAVLQVWFRMFTGRERDRAAVLGVRGPERFAVMLLTALILGGGLVPQPGLSSRYHAAMELLGTRHRDLEQPAPDPNQPETVLSPGHQSGWPFAPTSALKDEDHE